MATMFHRNVRVLQAFIGTSQLLTMVHGCHGEEGAWFRACIEEWSARVSTMPKTYEQDGLGDDAIVYLHYFLGNMDWYITERDQESAQHQAFGYADFHDGCAELGYISLVELLDNGAELDLYWTPKALKEVQAMNTGA